MNNSMCGRKLTCLLCDCQLESSYSILSSEQKFRTYGKLTKLVSVGNSHTSQCFAAAQVNEQKGASEMH